MPLPDNTRFCRLFSACLLFLLLAACASNDRFNAEAWQRSSGTDYKDNTRCQMVHDLMDNYLNVGLSRAEVFDLLGNPSEESVVNVPVGVCDFGVDYSYLTLTFDESGKLKDFRLIQG